MPRIESNELVATPKNWNHIDEWIRLHKPEEQAHLHVAAMMAWNFAAAITNIEDDVLVKTKKLTNLL